MRNFGQMKCKRCYSHYMKFPPPGGCPATDAMRQALSRFKAANGRTWKAKLRAVWERACVDVMDLDERALLQRCRNVIGPRRLDHIRVPELKGKS